MYVHISAAQIESNFKRKLSSNIHIGLSLYIQKSKLTSFCDYVYLETSERKVCKGTVPLDSWYVTEYHKEGFCK